MIGNACRKTALAILVLGLAGGSHLLRAGVYRETKEFQEDFEEGKALSLETLSGSVVIRGDDGNVVHVKAVENVEGEEDEAAEALEQFKVEVKRDRDRIEVVARFPNRRGLLSRIFDRGCESDHAWIDFEITVPSRLKVDVDATSADVDIADVAGDVSLDLTSGNVTGRDLGGDVTVDGTDGAIELRDVAGDIAIDNTSGDVVIDTCRGGVEVDKTSGGVTLREIEGDVTVDGTSSDVQGEGIGGFVSLDLVSGDVDLDRVGEGVSFDAISGDIRVSFEGTPSRACRFDSVSGDVRLFMKGQGDLELDLGSVSGELKVEMEGLRVREASESSLKAYTGNGRVKVRVETVSGDVEIRGTE